MRAVAREADGVGGEIVLVLDDADRLELAAVDAVARCGRPPAPRVLEARRGAQLPVEHDARQSSLAVLEQQLALAGADVDAIDVVPGLVAVVDGDGEHVGVVEAQMPCDARLHARRAASGRAPRRRRSSTA